MYSKFCISRTEFSAKLSLIGKLNKIYNNGTCLCIYVKLISTKVSKLNVTM